MNIIIKYGPDIAQKSFTTTPTFGQVLGNSDIKAFLGYGDNTRPLVSGVEQGLDSLVPDGATIVVETKCNEKASPDITYSVKFGPDIVTRTVPGYISIGEILENENLAAYFGWGDNVRALIGGVEQPDDAGVPHGATVVIETAANEKAS